MTGVVRRAVVLFARGKNARAPRKKLEAPRTVHPLSMERTARAVSLLGDADLVLVGGVDRPVLAPHARILRQRGRSFGDKILAAFEDVRALGYTEIVALVEDTQALDKSVLKNAFSALEKLTFVLGPSPDGGVYLIGARLPVDRIFEGVRWRTQLTCADLLARARDAALLSPLNPLNFSQQK